MAKKYTKEQILEAFDAHIGPGSEHDDQTASKYLLQFLPGASRSAIAKVLRDDMKEGF